MGKIDIRRIDDLDNDSVSFQKIKKKKPTDQNETVQQDRKTTKHKK
jgi:hypothetical protein